MSGPPGVHTQCEGKIASRTENYTRELAEAAVQAIMRNDATQLSAPHSKGSNPPKGLAALKMHEGDIIDLTYASTSDLPDEEGSCHRSSENSGCSGALGMVTRIISPKSPEFHSQRGKKAIDAEVNDLRAEAVWDEDSVQ